MHLATGLGAAFAQRGEEMFAILVVPKDGFAAAAAIQHVKIAPGYCTLSFRAMPGDPECRSSFRQRHILQ